MHALRAARLDRALEADVGERLRCTSRATRTTVANVRALGRVEVEHEVRDVVACVRP